MGGTRRHSDAWPSQENRAFRLAPPVLYLTKIMSFASYLNAALGLAMALTCGACGESAPSPEDCTPPAETPEFAIGTGELCFAPLADGDVVPMMNGPQGGYHLWLALGCTDCGGAVQVQYKLLDPETEELIPGTYDLNTASAQLGGEWPQAAGIQLAMPGSDWDEESDPPLAKGTKVLVQVRVLDGKGAAEKHHGQVTIEIGDIEAWDPCDADPDADCCNESCN
jgi:hypothetical protein